MGLKVYAYKGCDTCRRALKFLEGRAVPHEVIPIRERPPTVAELKAALGAQGGEVRKLFNTSGQDYKAMGLKDTLPTMGVDEALALLSKNGNLVKRPFVIGEGKALVGFQEEAWREHFAR
jgi:arsenate reductase